MSSIPARTKIRICKVKVVSTRETPKPQICLRNKIKIFYFPMKQHQPSPAPKAPKEEGAGRGHRLQPGLDPSPVGVRSPPRTATAPRCHPAARATPRAQANILCQGTAQEGLISWHRGWMKMGRALLGWPPRAASCRTKPSACPMQLRAAAPRPKAKGWGWLQGKHPGAGWEAAFPLPRQEGG